MSNTSIRKWFASLTAAVLLLGGCKTYVPPAETTKPSPSETAETAAEKNGDVVILYTSDIHCGISTGLGLEGLVDIRKKLEDNGTETILVDDGDAIQGDAIGTITKGEAILDLMNEAKYDIAIPGNHEFDYGMDEFLSLTEKANFPYISCNFSHDGKLIFEPYIIKEAAGKKIAFIGVTTPRTLTESSPDHFMDENGNFIYDFLYDETGDKLITAIQGYIDEVRAKGVDYVILLAHIGNKENAYPFNFQTIIERTSGIDVMLDGHSHDTDQVKMNNKDGEPVIRSACGTKMAAIGFLHIPADDSELKSGLIDWNNDESVPSLFHISNDMTAAIKAEEDGLQETLKEKIGETPFDLVIEDPEKKDSNGKKIRIVRKAETNLGDLICDALKSETKAQIVMYNGGGIRQTIKAGDITYGDIMGVMPYTNDICVSEVTGQQILDALEWGSSMIPDENGGFMQVAGLTYEIHAEIPSSCSVDTQGMFASVDGEYRVKNVTVEGEPLDLKKKYTVAGNDFIMKKKGNGYTMFGEEDVVLDQIKMDNKALMDYLQNELNGAVPDEYKNPYGQGRIIITGVE